MGGVTRTWVTFKEVYGQLQFSNSRQVIAARQVNSEIVGMATVRYTEGITADMRINHNGTLYDIEEPINVDGKNRWLKIPIRSGVNSG